MQERLQKIYPRPHITDITLLLVGIVVAYVLYAPPAYAYLDPGTGSVLIYVLFGLVTATVFSLKTIVHKACIVAPGMLHRKTLRTESAEIIFYSEGAQYWLVFSPIIKALCDKGVQCTYLTSDTSDVGLEYESKLCTTSYIGNGMKAYAHVNSLSAKIVVMTTPQLDVFELQRSKKVRHYAHVMHAPTDALFYKKYAFDAFDSVFCSGPHQIKHIRALEQLRGLPKKELFRTGLTYYDAMLEMMADMSTEPSAKKTVFVASTWGPNSMFTKYGIDFMRKLAGMPLQFIIRPHPQMRQSQRSLYADLENLAEEYGNIALDNRRSPTGSLLSADVMISDISGVIFDYAFLLQRPMIIVDTDVGRAGFEAEDIDEDAWEIDARTKVGTVVPGEKLDQLDAILRGIVARGTLSTNAKARIASLRQSSVYHFGQAGGVAAEQICTILSAMS